MGSQDIHAPLHRLRANVKQDHQFLFMNRIDLVPRLQASFLPQRFFKRHIPCRLCHLPDTDGAFTLRLTV